MQGASEHFQGVSERPVKHEVWRLVTLHTRRKSPPPPKNLKFTNRTGIFYKRHEALGLEGKSTDEVGEGPTGMEGPARAVEPPPGIISFSGTVCNTMGLEYTELAVGNGMTLF